MHGFHQVVRRIGHNCFGSCLINFDRVLVPRIVREIRADVEADEAKEIADDPTLDPQHAKNRIDIRKWRSSKHNSRVYGDRVDLNVQQSISVLEVRTEALGRVLRPVIDQRSSDDESIIDCAIVKPSGPTEPHSDSEPGQVAGPDIFT